ncbi:MAG: tRNA (adenine-N1)-methyltransferase [Candidatus Bathyarchaeota archaeon]
MIESASEVLVAEGDDILLFLDLRRTYLVKVRSGEKFHTHKGFIQLNDILGKRFGDKVTTNLGFSFSILKPSIYDYLDKALRSTQIVYLKDVALITAYSGVGPGSKVIEAGTGSGALTSALAHYVQPEGKVYSYDIKVEFQEKALRNLVRAGVAEFVELKAGDAVEGFAERGVDAVILDMATPWLVVPRAYEALRGGGSIVSFSPTIEQVVKTVNALNEGGFVSMESVECISRRFKVKEGETRPETLMIGHTGYITHARKVFKE